MDSLPTGRQADIPPIDIPLVRNSGMTYLQLYRKPMKPKYWTIFILASAAIIASLFYYLRQPAAYSGLIVVPHEHPAQPQATTSPQTTDNLQDWKTYTNSKYGYEINYPSNWQYLECYQGQQFFLYAPDDALETCDAPRGETDEIDVISALPSGKPEVLPAKSQEPLTINGIKAIKYIQYAIGQDPVNDPTYINAVIISNNSQNYEVDLMNDSPIVEQILSTFQFTTPTPLATSSPTTQVQTDTRGWQTYVNSQYGFSFENPSTTQIAVYTNGKLTSGNENDYGLNVGLYSYDYFNWTLNDGTSEEALKYNQAAKQWQVSLGTNEQASDAFCPEAETTNPQQVPYYQIGDFRTGRDWDFAYVTTKGIIVLTELDGSIPNGVDPAEVKFDNPTDVLKVTCNIK
jgi:hypothetical protein